MMLDKTKRIAKTLMNAIQKYMGINNESDQHMQTLAKLSQIFTAKVDEQDAKDSNKTAEQTSTNPTNPKQIHEEPRIHLKRTRNNIPLAD